MAAIESAGRDGKYVFFFFWKENDQQTGAMHGVLQTAMRQWAESADSIAIQIADASEKPVVDKFGVSRAPMPLVVAMAPNGAITKGFPIKCHRRATRTGVCQPVYGPMPQVPPGPEVGSAVHPEPKDAVQPGGVARRAGLQGRREVRQSDRDRHREPRGSGGGHAAAETSRSIPRTSQAVTVVLAPPGQPVATFAGPVTKDQIVAKIASAQSGACAGGKCGPGGCGPKKYGGARMTLRTLVWRELFERKSQMLTCFLAIFLGITTVVAIRNVTHYSEKAVARGNGQPRGQRPGVAQVRDAARLLLGGHERGDDSGRIRDAADHVRNPRRRQPVAEAVRPRRSAGEDNSR